MSPYEFVQRVLRVAVPERARIDVNYFVYVFVKPLAGIVFLYEEKRPNVRSATVVRVQPPCRRSTLTKWQLPVRVRVRNTGINYLSNVGLIRIVKIAIDSRIDVPPQPPKTYREKRKEK